MTTTSPQIPLPIAIRRAGTADRGALERLAVLDSAPVPVGDVLIASVDGEDRAAVSVTSGAVVADPFRPTADLVALLSLRAGSLRGPAPRRRGFSAAVRVPRRRARLAG